MSGMPRGGISGEGDRQAEGLRVAAAPANRPAARAALAAARTPADLFPADDAAAVRLHRRLARLLHPDSVPEPERAWLARSQRREQGDDRLLALYWRFAVLTVDHETIRAVS